MIPAMRRPPHASIPVAALLSLPWFAACLAPPLPMEPPIPGAVQVDHLIQPGERHFEHLWLVASGGENAEGYWSFDGMSLSLQRANPDEGIPCDQIYTTAVGGALRQVSDGRGRTTCAHYLPGDLEVVYASTAGASAECPAAPDRSEGYVWALYPDFDIYVTDLRNMSTRPFISGPGYDAEATVSPRGDRIVFTSLRSGDPELWVCDIDGSNPTQVTDTLGYDGGAFFSHDGEWLVYRRTTFTPGKEEEEQARYVELLSQNKVAPGNMELWRVRPDGSDAQQITKLGKANWAPSYSPDDRRILFSSNHHDPNRPGLNFDIFAVAADGGGLERITYYNEGMGRQFDAFPMFSPDGKHLAFSSNRGPGASGETHLYVAEWRD